MARRPALAPLALVALWLASGCGEARAPGPSVVLVVLDTLRADGLSAYGNPRPTSPALDRLAAEGVLFEQAISHAAWTLPGFVGLLSARQPAADVHSGGRLRRSLVSAFRSSGFTTAAFTEGAYVSAAFGMDLGFEHFEAREAAIRVQVPGGGKPRRGGGIRHTFDAAIGWLRAHRGEQFFLLIHSYEPHLPYRRRTYAEALPSGALGRTYEIRDAQAVARGLVAAGDTERRYVRALYDGGVRAADEQVGRLLDALDALGLSARTIVAVTSDHGEDLGDRAPEALGRHQHQLHDELLHVPLIVRDPREAWPERRITGQVRLIDVMPTLLDLVGVDPPTDTDGRSLVPLMRGVMEPPRAAFASLDLEDRRLRALRARGAKVIVEERLDGREEPSMRLYDLVHDPGERADLAGRGRPEEARLAAELLAVRRAVEARGSGSLNALPSDDPELVSQLEALGYLGRSDATEASPADEAAGSP